MRIVWTRRAAEELDAEAAWIAVDRPRVARDLVKRIRGSVARLKDFPGSGRVVSEFAGMNVREIVMGPYRILYRPERTHIAVLTVKHSREELKPEDLRPDYP